MLIFYESGPKKTVCQKGHLPRCHQKKPCRKLTYDTAFKISDRTVYQMRTLSDFPSWRMIYIPRVRVLRALLSASLRILIPSRS